MRYETLDYIVAVAVAFFLISCGGKNRDADNHGQMFDKPVSEGLRYGSSSGSGRFGTGIYGEFRISRGVSVRYSTGHCA